MTDTMAGSIIGSNVTGTKIKILGHIIDPVVDSIIEVKIYQKLKWITTVRHKKVLMKWN